jgi:ribonuclease E
LFAPVAAGNVAGAALHPREPGSLAGVVADGATRREVQQSSPLAAAHGSAPGRGAGATADPSHGRAGPDAAAGTGEIRNSMSKVMLVNVTHVEESRVAILEDGVLAQYEIETINRTNIKGNIHNAVVENVHPSLEAAFLRLSSDLKGFLPLDEVNFKLLPSRQDSRARGRIGQHLHPGQRLMVQVVREPFAGKPPTVTTYFSLPGRYLVLMPGVDSAGVSRKIEDATQRDQLRKLVEELKPPEGFGLIVRTAGLGQTKMELQRDLRYLLRLWESIQRASKATDFPGLVYRERDLVIRTIRDYFTPDIDEVWIDSPETYDRALEFVRDVMPGKAKIVKLHAGDRPLFSKFNLEDQIESIYKRRVPLKSGGEIVIDGTEALTAIDVNSARASRQGDAEENALATNLEAAAEIARQFRLRDLGGLVVVDFIDMAAARNQKKVEKAMRDAMRTDRAKYDVTRISKLGLMEIARQRIKGEKLGASYATCPACEGFGLVKNVEPAGLAALRKLQARCLRGDFGRMRMALPPDVASWILNNKRDDLVQLEKRHGIRVTVESKPALKRHESEFEAFPREKVEEPPALVTGDRPAPQIPPDLKDLGEMAAEQAAAEPAPAAEASAPTESGGRKRRRRRRRHSRGAGVVPESSVAGPREADEGSPDDAESEPPDATAGFDEEETAGSGETGPEPATAAEPDVAAAPHSAESDDSGPHDDGEGGEGGGASRRRRRRRRRRRSRGVFNGTQPQSDARSPAPADGGSDEREEPVVPRNIRSEELMPAATGKAGRAKASGGARPRPRRRRRGAPEIANGNGSVGAPAGSFPSGPPRESGPSGGNPDR